MTFSLIGHAPGCVLHIQRRIDHRTDTRIVELRAECVEECPVREPEETSKEEEAKSA